MFGSALCQIENKKESQLSDPYSTQVTMVFRNKAIKMSLQTEELGAESFT